MPGSLLISTTLTSTKQLAKSVRQVLFGLRTAVVKPSFAAGAKFAENEVTTCVAGLDSVGRNCMDTEVHRRFQRVAVQQALGMIPCRFKA